LPRLLVEAGLAASNGEARRAVKQGGVKLDGHPLTDPDADLRSDELAGKVLQVGRRRPPIQLGLALAPALTCCLSAARLRQRASR